MAAHARTADRVATAATGYVAVLHAPRLHASDARRLHARAQRGCGTGPHLVLRRGLPRIEHRRLRRPAVLERRRVREGLDRARRQAGIRRGRARTAGPARDGAGGAKVWRGHHARRHPRVVCRRATGARAVGRPRSLEGMAMGTAGPGRDGAGGSRTRAPARRELHEQLLDPPAGSCAGGTKVDVCLVRLAAGRAADVGVAGVSNAPVTGHPHRAPATLLADGLRRVIRAPAILCGVWAITATVALRPAATLYRAI